MNWLFRWHLEQKRTETPVQKEEGEEKKDDKEGEKVIKENLI